MTTLQSARLRLRPAREDDAEALLAAMEPATTQNLSFFRDPIDLDRQRSYLRRMQSAQDRLFVIELRDGEHIVGTCGIHEYDRHNDNGRMGLLIFRESDRALGYGSEATELLMCWAFTALELHKLYVRILMTNDAARAHYLKLGFKEEGVMREEYKLGGEYHDMILFSLLKREWEARRG